ncbi:MAG: hypothetical protein Q7I97_08805 [Thermovirgaceae bacterium]|nr:hypothetical protein [Thermovirgaceae bacterium]
MFACQTWSVTMGTFILDGDSDCRKRARELAAMGDDPEVLTQWLLLADEAAGSRDWLLSEYAYKKGLGLQVLW